MSWLLLALAIALEIAGTANMKLSQGFTRLVPSVFIFVFYGMSIGALTMALKRIDVSVAYAVWSGLGTALIAMLGMLVFREQVSVMKLFALSMIVVGVAMLNLTGKAG